jgi:hypothetical protein
MRTPPSRRPYFPYSPRCRRVMVCVAPLRHLSPTQKIPRPRHCSGSRFALDQFPFVRISGGPSQCLAHRNPAPRLFRYLGHSTLPAKALELLSRRRHPAPLRRPHGRPDDLFPAPRPFFGQFLLMELPSALAGPGFPPHGLTCTMGGTGPRRFPQWRNFELRPARPDGRQGEKFCPHRHHRGKHTDPCGRGTECLKVFEISSFAAT